jgi:methylmalonyl-CoA mutase
MKNIVQLEGRRPRILLAHLETDQPDRWTKPLAASLAEYGFDVDIGPTHQTPSQAARLAIDNDVHAVCVSISSVTHQALAVRLIKALQATGGADIRLVVGGTEVGSHHEKMNRAGVDLIVDLDNIDINLIDQMLNLFDEPGP